MHNKLLLLILFLTLETLISCGTKSYKKDDTWVKNVKIDLVQKFENKENYEFKLKIQNRYDADILLFTGFFNGDHRFYKIDKDGDVLVLIMNSTIPECIDFEECPLSEFISVPKSSTKEIIIRVENIADMLKSDNYIYCGDKEAGNFNFISFRFTVYKSSKMFKKCDPTDNEACRISTCGFDDIMVHPDLMIKIPVP
jgi:hypothetical protein